MFPYGVQIMLSYVEISPIGLYTYYLFSSCFIYYIHSLTLRIISPILCCTCHIYRVRPCVVFHHALPCTCTYDRGTHRLSPLHIVLLSPLPWQHQNSLKIHIRQGKIKQLTLLLSPKCTCSTLFFNQFGPFLTLVFAFFSNYCYQASFSYKHLPSVTMFCNVNLFSCNRTHVFSKAGSIMS